MAKDANWAGPERAAHNKKKWRRPKAPALTLWLVCVLIFPGELGGGERGVALEIVDLHCCWHAFRYVCPVHF